MTDHETDDLSRIATRLRRLAVAFGVVSVAGACAWWWLVDLQTFLGDGCARMVLTPQTDRRMRMAGLTIEFLPLAAELWMVWLLYQFASKIEIGQVFSTQRLYRGLGMAAIFLGFIEALAGTLHRLVLTLIGNPHLLSVGLAISTGDLYLMLVGAILLATASFISRAQTVQRENDAFV